ncbi:hypothetical protein PR001_g4635 [Phytophthora rubi]|uniref:Tc1-like transposase DDE domain-containing protein n=1 Tax=Phytophthora rubi TaxID=129364 RepID=A0A6A3P0U9_9STRA|nr:hypothetical protein PR001_g4635 [Phytophthora rubi]
MSGFWSRVLFCDEACVEFHGTSGRVSVWRRTHEAFSPKCVIPTFKSRLKSVMVWSSITASGVGTMHFFDESVNGVYYRFLLRKQIPITKLLLGQSDETLFVQDNTPAHSAKLTAKGLRDLKLISLGHTPQSPDLNPIENLWFLMKQELHRDPAKAADGLKTKLLNIWTSIDDATVEKCVLSMPKRLEQASATIVKQSIRVARKRSDSLGQTCIPGRPKGTPQKPQTTKKNTEALAATHLEFALYFWEEFGDAYKLSEINNVGVTGIDFDMPPKQMWAGKGRRDSAKVLGLEKHSTRLTAVLTARADGIKLPILFIVRGKPGGSIEAKELNKYPKGHVYVVQENAWMNARVWKIYTSELLKY